jgi:hypothetical protein
MQVSDVSCLVGKSKQNQIKKKQAIENTTRAFSSDGFTTDSLMCRFVYAHACVWLWDVVRMNLCVLLRA